MKKTPELVGTMIVAVALASGVACQRATTGTEAHRAADEIKTGASRAGEEIKVVASRAGDQLADSWITTKIQAQYFADNDIKARYINVSTRDAVVTLTGRVENQNAHDQALQTAKNTDGVRDVHDKLTVGPPSPQNAASGIPERMDAAWITTRIQAKYFADPAITSRDITVSTTNDVVTLAGRADTEQEKQHALEIARGTEGVSRVDDRLMVQPSGLVATTGTVASDGSAVGGQTDDRRVTSAIQSKYFLDDLVKGRHIAVEANHGVVTLRGEVANESERAQALLLARTTDGVQRVEDNMGVTAVSASPAAANPMTAPSVEGSRAAGAMAPGAKTPAAARGTAAIDASRTESHVDDDTLTTKIRSRFFLDRHVPSGAIEVTSKDGVVLLQGTVPTEVIRKQALSIARTTDGVVQVVDRLKVGARKQK